MRDRLLVYLQSAGRPLPADQILRDVLHIVSPGTLASQGVLKNILKGDPRFVCARGLWSVRGGAASDAPLAPRDATALVVQQARGSHDPLLVRGAVYCGADALEFGTPEPAGRVRHDELRRAAGMMAGRLVVAWDSRSLRTWQRALRAAGLPPWEGEAVSLVVLARRLFPRLPGRASVEDVAAALAMAPPDPESARALARFAAGAFSACLDLIPTEGRRDAAALGRWIAAVDAPVDFSSFAFGPELLAELPETPGVYVMRDREGAAVYVGKAANLRRRVRSYFARGALRAAKIRALHAQLHTIEVFTAESEIEALIAELRCIREMRPPVNKQAEVHERAAGYGRERNLLLLVPAASGVRAEIYFLKAGVFAARLGAPLGRAPSRALKSKVRRIYYGRRHTTGPGDPREREIIFRWLARNRRKLNFVDLDDAGCYDDAMRRVSDYLLDPGRLATKVFYR